MGSAFGAAGQRCLAGSVCVIAGDEARQAEVREALRAAAKRFAWDARIEDSPAAPGREVEEATCVMCPMVAPEARKRAEAAVATAESEGATVLLDGRLGGGEAGTLLGPTLVEVSDPESELAREEIFGPVLALISAPDLEAALAFANGSRYGNAGSIFTTSGAAARAYRWGIEAGMLGVNIGVPAPVAWFPFSGWKDSIDGDLHANGPDAVDFYTRKKVVTSRW
jgi:malonate-semialdehyde dehydrogenase (acetylating)/methylmalonate-semialdehyde dehydrogenase